MYFNLFLIHIIYKNNPKYKTHIMKKVILTISIGPAPGVDCINFSSISKSYAFITVLRDTPMSLASVLVEGNFEFLINALLIIEPLIDSYRFI